MWVFHKEHGIGILLNLHNGDLALVMFTDSDTGLNRVEATVLATDLRQAWYDEIPKERRPSIERAAVMGYHVKADAWQS